MFRRIYGRISLGIVIAAALSIGAGAAGAVPQAQAEPALAAGRVVTNTGYIEAIAIVQNTAWVATRGGLEVYSLAARQRLQVYTTAHGLASIHVRGVRAVGATIEARTSDHVCWLGAGAFACVPAPSLPAAEPVVAPRFAGARMTARVPIAGGELIGTAGGGLWLRASARPEQPILLSASGQVCSNHVMAMAEFRGRLYLGSFDQGLCVTDGRGFRTLDTPFRMVNDVVATPKGLYVAANAGLFHAADGEHFVRVPYVTARGLNGLAFDGRTLYATSPGALWRLRVRGGPRNGQFWRPGGSRAVQKVAVGAGAVWLATEDRGVIRFAQNTFDVFDRASGLPTSWVMDVAVGAGNTVYAATFRHGALALSPTADGGVSARPITGLPDNWLLHISAQGKTLWVGTQEGAARLDGATVTPVAAPLPHPCVHAIAHFGASTWLATEGGLYLLPRRLPQAGNST